MKVKSDITGRNYRVLTSEGPESRGSVGPGWVGGGKLQLLCFPSPSIVSSLDYGQLLLHYLLTKDLLWRPLSSEAEISPWNIGAS